MEEAYEKRGRKGLGNRSEKAGILAERGRNAVTEGVGRSYTSDRLPLKFIGPIVQFER